MAGQGLSWFCQSPEPPGHERMEGGEEKRQLPGQKEIHPVNCWLKEKLCISNGLLKLTVQLLCVDG